MVVFFYYSLKGVLCMFNCGPDPNLMEANRNLSLALFHGIVRQFNCWKFYLLQIKCISFVRVFLLQALAMYALLCLVSITVSIFFCIVSSCCLLTCYVQWCLHADCHSLDFQADCHNLDLLLLFFLACMLRVCSDVQACGLCSVTNCIHCMSNHARHC